MNQNANALDGDIFFEIISQQRPDWLGPINPYNDAITKIFGNQGGY